MGNIILAIVLCLLLPLLLLSVYSDRKNRTLMFSMTAGILACLGAYFINEALMKKFGMDSGSFETTVSPIIEEILKFLPVLVLTKFCKKDRHDTAALAFAVGVGFCVVENFYYLMNAGGSVSIPWVVMRSVGTGLMHGMSSTILGIGLFYARQEKYMRAQLLGGTLTFSVIYHGLYNLLVQSSGVLQFMGVALPICTYVFLFIFMNGNNLQKLLPEVNGKQE